MFGWKKRALYHKKNYEDAIHRIAILEGNRQDLLNDLAQAKDKRERLIERITDLQERIYYTMKYLRRFETNAIARNGCNLLLIEKTSRTVKDWSSQIAQWGRRKGWDDIGIISQKLLLIVSEITEANEELRTGNHHGLIYYIKDKEGIEKPEGFSIELADALIRILHLAALLNIDLEHCMDIKMAYNEKRPYKHGGKLF